MGAPGTNNSLGIDEVVFFDWEALECTLMTERELDDDDLDEGEKLLWSGADDVELDEEEDLCLALGRF